MLSALTVSLRVGRPQTVMYSGKPVETAFWKEQAREPLLLRKLNFEGDEQADLRYHGGPDKAVCAYCEEHYPHWRERFGREFAFGAFGENATLRGADEQTVCIGDTFRFGEAVVQVTQPRQPCYKVSVKNGIEELPQAMIDLSYTGYYLRVLEEGLVQVADRLELLRREPVLVTVAEANRLRYKDRRDAEGIRRLLSVEGLSHNWRQTFEKRLAEL